MPPTGAGGGFGKRRSLQTREGNTCPVQPAEHPELLRARRWAQAHRPLLELGFERFADSGRWPALEQLQHDFELAGRPEDVAALAWQMPKALGFVERQQLVLLAGALIYVPAAEPLLADWCTVLRFAYERWRENPDAELSRRDVLGLLDGDQARTRAVSVILLRESWPFGSGTGGEDDDWHRELHSGVRAVRSARSAAEIIAARQAITYPPPQPPEPPAPAPKPLRSRLAPVARGWGLISHHPLWSALLAAVLAGIVLNLLLGQTGQPAAGPRGSGTVGSPAGGGAASGRTHREQAGAGGARTFNSSYTQSVSGPAVAPNQYVQVRCRVFEPQPPSVLPDGYWYLIASPPWSGRYYAPANSFWNGDIPGHKPYTHNTDFSVPKC